MTPGVVGLRRFAGAAAVAMTALIVAGAGFGGSAVAAGSPPPLVDVPVDGEFQWGDRFGDWRSGGRTHQGVDLHAPKLTPLVAPWDGEVTDIDVVGGEPDPGHDQASEARAGNALSIRRGEWTVDYFHLNNDTPGTDDGANPPHWAFVSQLRVGAWVLAGQRVGYVGDSGNAESTPPHLHLELHDPDGQAVDPEPSVRAAGSGIPRPVAAGVSLQSGGGHWVLDRTGGVHALAGAPHLGEPAFGWDVARDVAAMPDGAGYAVLDAWGGLHLYGSARDRLTGLGGPYWPGRDLARALAIAPDGLGYVVLDAWGGVHQRGSAAGLPPVSGAYWPGWDIARDVAITPDGAGLVVLDGWGGRHASGTAIPTVGRHPTPYWSGWDIARAVAVSGDGLAVLDAWGGLHARGELAGRDPGAHRPGTRWVDADVTTQRAVTLRRDGLQLSG